MNDKSIAQQQAAVAYPALVGKVLAREREARSQKQTDVASKLGLSQSAFSRLEAGESVLNLAQMHKLCAEFGLRPSEVLREADALETQLKARGVDVLHEKPDNAAALAIGLGLLAALLLSGGR